MTDRELLEAAAKAAGIPRDKEVAQLPDGMPAFWVVEPSPHWWEPLHNDGDAFRLAVKLCFRVDAGYCGCADVRGYMVDATEALGHDACAATRRAIVRAAAQMGLQGG